jgi:hypothetical protein
MNPFNETRAIQVATADHPVAHALTHVLATNRVICNTYLCWR